VAKLFEGRRNDYRNHDSAFRILEVDWSPLTNINSGVLYG